MDFMLESPGRRPLDSRSRQIPRAHPNEHERNSMAAALNAVARPTLPVALLLVGAALFTSRAAFALAPPSNVSATSDCEKITISATPVPDATGYVVRIYVEDYLPALPDTTISSFPFLDYAPGGQRRSYQFA